MELVVSALSVYICRVVFVWGELGQCMYSAIKMSYNVLITGHNEPSTSLYYNITQDNGKNLSRLISLGGYVWSDRGSWPYQNQ